MKISVHIKPNARHEKIEVLAPNEYRVAVKAPPTDGKANQALIKILAEYFKVPQSSVIILHGLASKKKWIEITE